MQGLLGRAAGGLPNTVQPGALQQLLLKGLGANQELARLEACTGPGITPTDGHDGACSPSTSYGRPPHPLHAQHHHHRQQPPCGTIAATNAPIQLQQLRAYRIPNRVLQPKVPYSVRSGRPAPQPWPEFEALKAPAGELRWHRSVVRFPPEVSVDLEESGAQEQGRTLVISGKAGIIRLNLQALDPTGLLAFRLVRLPSIAGGSSAAATAAPAPPAAAKAAGAAKAAAGSSNAAPAAAAPVGRSMLALVSPDKASFEAVGAELNKAIRGVMAGYLLGITVKGVGYRMEPLEEGAGETRARAVSLTAAQLARRKRAPGGSTPKPYYFESSSVEKQSVTFPYNKPASAIRLKVGFSRTAVYPLPPHIRAFFLKPTLLYLYGLELDELKRVAAEIRSIRKPNPYTGNGVQYVDEVVRIKQRAGAK